MTQERPLSILILGLVNLLAAGLCLFAGVAKAGRSLLMLAMGPGDRENTYFGTLRLQDRNIPIPDLETYLELEIPSYTGWQMGAVLAILAAGVVLWAIGYGLLHMRPWARSLALLYALAMIAWQAAYGLFHVARVLPVAEIYFLDESWRSYGYMPSSIGLARVSFLLFAGGSAALLVGHAALVLLVLWLPSVRAAFRGQTERDEPAAISSESRAETAPGSV